MADYYTSTNAGATWISNGMPSVSWGAVASSADGLKLVAAAVVSGIHRIFTSSNGGNTWVTNQAPISRVSFIASSADGAEMAAVEQDRIWSSTNSGATWTSNNMTGFWLGVASSADGSKWVAANASPGAIWTLQTPPAPQINITPTNSNLALSWIVPSTSFVLQRSSDLSSWTDMTNPPVLNLTNLQEALVLSPTNSSGFFRLKTP
jgi:hypothetical protein